MDADLLLRALTFSAGYNAALVAVGATLLGITAGAIGCFVLLRRRAMVSDAISHATLPGIGIAFIIMASLGGEGRFLPGLLVGAAVTAGFGLWAVEWMTKRTRLTEDAAIGAVLSVTFGLGIVFLTIIQTLGIGKPAGLEGFLLGGAAAMLRAEAISVLVMAGLVAVVIALSWRRMVLVAFDQGYAETLGIKTNHTDRLMMLLALAVTVIGLKIVGLILIVALMIIPPVAARFWTDRADRMMLIAGGLGGIACFLGTAISASGDDLPTGAVIVLTATCLFTISMLFAPSRGVLAAWLAWSRFQKVVHRRQGLLALSRGEPILEPVSRRLLAREGLLQPDGVPTLEGKAAARLVAEDEARWALARRRDPDGALAGRYDGLTPITQVLTPDQIAVLDADVRGQPALVAGVGGGRLAHE
ncbi:MAG: metal ABC transporter permease [Pseudomonadota bacterium]